MQPVPDSVTREQDRDIYHSTQLARAAMKQLTEMVGELRQLAIDVKAGNSETPANITIAYRHLEDASMRLGKVLQSLDGGVSVYDKATTPEVREIGTPRDLADGRHATRAALPRTDCDCGQPWLVGTHSDKGCAP